MNQFNSFSLILVLLLLILVPNIATASLDSTTTEIPYQINNSDRIVIGAVSGINVYSDHTIYTITVKEWLYNPLPIDTIKVKTKVGTNIWVEDEAELTKNESALLMLQDLDANNQLFRVTFGFPGKRPVSDRDAVIKELKAQDKWQEENSTTQKSKKIPFISPIWLLTIVFIVVYVKK